MNDSGDTKLHVTKCLVLLAGNGAALLFALQMTLDVVNSSTVSVCASANLGVAAFVAVTSVVGIVAGFLSLTSRYADVFANFTLVIAMTSIALLLLASASAPLLLNHYLVRDGSLGC